MIARTWHGAVPAAKADAYHRYLLRTGLTDYETTPGNRGVLPLRRLDGDLAHFLMVTLWDDLRAIRAFAGDDVLRARYYPEDDDFLVEREPIVTHFDVTMAPTWGAASGGVARLWHGWTSRADADAYDALLTGEIVPGIESRGVDGYRGMTVWRREAEGEVVFATLMRFDGMDAVRAFAGEDVEAAVVPERVRALLTRFDARSIHYDVLSLEATDARP